MHKISIALGLVFLAFTTTTSTAKVHSVPSGYYTEWKLYNSFGVPTVSCSYKRDYISYKTGKVEKTERMTTSPTLIRTGSGFRYGCAPTAPAR